MMKNLIESERLFTTPAALDQLLEDIFPDVAANAQAGDSTVYSGSVCLHDFRSQPAINAFFQQLQRQIRSKLVAARSVVWVQGSEEFPHDPMFGRFKFTGTLRVPVDGPYILEARSRLIERLGSLHQEPGSIAAALEIGNQLLALDRCYQALTNGGLPPP
jgi:hypothetical protein